MASVNVTGQDERAERPNGPLDGRRHGAEIAFISEIPDETTKGMTAYRKP